MPRFHVMSDLHREEGYDFPPATADIDGLIIAGDTQDNIEWLAECRAFYGPELPILTVPGNHEHYDSSVEEIERACDTAWKKHQIHILRAGSPPVIIRGTRFIGATLWTDFKLTGNQVLSVHECRTIRDFRYSRYQGRLLRPNDVIRFHERDSNHIDRSLSQAHPGPTVVVTHFMPIPEAIAPIYKGDPAKPFFCSDMRGLIAEFEPDAWIFGHTHTPYDGLSIASKKTRFICNPRGRLNEGVQFDPEKILET
ncbi:MAG: hypothetical protein DDT34_02511 [Firmicutes bacterium]|nr:hypothetical protein [Bacillota bacterium]